MLGPGTVLWSCFRVHVKHVKKLDVHVGCFLWEWKHFYLILHAAFPLNSKTKAARVIGLIAGNAEDLDESVTISESIATLTEIIRENVKNGKLKQGVLPAVGELLYFVAQQVKKRNINYHTLLINRELYECRDTKTPIIFNYFFWLFFLIEKKLLFDNLFKKLKKFEMYLNVCLCEIAEAFYTMSFIVGSEAWKDMWQLERDLNDLHCHHQVLQGRGKIYHRKQLLFTSYFYWYTTNVRFSIWFLM